MREMKYLWQKNYCPVSILSPLNKILESVMYEQMYEYFSSSKIFNENMHGFRKNRSTLTILLQMYQRWLDTSNKEEFSGIVLFDQSCSLRFGLSKITSGEV